MVMMLALMALLNAFTTVACFICGVTILVTIRHLVVDYRISRAGGVRAPILAGNLLSASAFYYNVGKYQYRNKLFELINNKLDSLPQGQQGFAELSLTGSKRVLITRDAKQIKAVLATKSAHFGHGPMWHKLWRPFLGDGIFATDGQMWHDSRQMIKPMFSKDRVRNLAIFDACTDRLLSKLSPPGTTVDMKELLYRWALDTMTEFLLGENVNSLDSPIAPLIPKGDYYQAIRKIDQFVEPVIVRALAIPQSRLDELSKSDDDFTFLHSIARHTRDPKVIRDQVMSVLLAGRDTTAATLSWAIYELSAYPQKWATLRSEVLDALGAHGTPSYEILKNIKYLKNVLNETLRLHPAVPINMRQVLQTTTIPNQPGKPDIVLLKGDSVTINTLGLHSRPDLYPPVSDKFADPKLFSPERWEHWTPTPWTFTPFHGGPRICIGQNFALTEMAFCLIRMAQKFERIEYRGDWAAQSLQADIIGTPALGVPVAFFEPGAHDAN
ncbi:Cytochrome P450 52A13 [Escovopsis weberi]|uniref:Cytochrome P450 52A13 n=1 Tax=Escovopsis weberi TaxID=150374 RepID=A0A0N0RU06_ESCWE|nr:Cytochrome P450 52A13 [Escovopsis weberi]